MPFCPNRELIKVFQKISLIAINWYLYVAISSIMPTCSAMDAGWEIYPFDRKFVTSSSLFMTSAAITIVEFNEWPQSTVAHRALLTFFVELYIMTACITIVYVVFWHPLVIATSMATAKLGAQLSWCLSSTNIYVKSMPICMRAMRSTEFQCVLLAALLLYGVLKKYGRRDLFRIQGVLWKCHNECSQ